MHKEIYNLLLFQYGPEALILYSFLKRVWKITVPNIDRDEQASIVMSLASSDIAAHTGLNKDEIKIAEEDLTSARILYKNERTDGRVEYRISLEEENELEKIARKGK